MGADPPLRLDVHESFMYFVHRSVLRIFSKSMYALITLSSNHCCPLIVLLDTIRELGLCYLNLTLVVCVCDKHGEDAGCVCVWAVGMGVNILCVVVREYVRSGVCVCV